MSNKTQLQLNNTDLQSILSTVLGLPTQDSVKHGAYVWKKFTAQGGDFVDFVVSDNESAYPDGGTQDGHWYELFVEKIVLPSRFTKIETKKVTFSSNVSGTTKVTHSLGVLPLAVLIFSDSLPTINNGIEFVLGGTSMGHNPWYYSSSYYYSTTGSIVSDGYQSMYVSESDMYFKNGVYQSGIEYTFVFIA